MKKDFNNKTALFMGLIILILFLLSLFSGYFKPQDSTITPIVNLSPTLDEQVIKNLDTKDYQVLLGSTKSEIVQKLGAPSDEYKKNSLVYLEYPSNSQTPYQFVFNKDILILVKDIVSTGDPRSEEKLFFDNADSTNTYVLIDPEFGGSLPVIIFPSDGIAGMAHVSDGKVFQIWHFIPSTRTEIRNTWGYELVPPDEFELHNH